MRVRTYEKYRHPMDDHELPRQAVLHGMTLVRIKMEHQTDRLIRLPEVLQMTSLGTTKIYNMMKEGRFQRQIKLGRKCVVWRLSEVASWMASLK